MMKSLLANLLLLVTVLSTNALPLIPSSEIATKSAQGLRLLSLSEGGSPVWKSENEVLDLVRQGKNFFDVTDTYELEQKIAEKVASAKKVADDLPLVYAPPSHADEVQAILATMTTANMEANLDVLTAFNNRYYTSQTGVDASNWILNKVKEIASTYGRSDIVASAFTHSWAQPSIIARIPGSDPSLPRVLLGAHLDSINLNNPTTGRAPGADDDGTGVVNLLEAYRALLEAGFKPKNTVEFQFYAAEEVGLKGSQAIATSYRNEGVQVKGHYQIDMTGYFAPGTKPVMALAPDYSDPALTNFTKQLITEYANIPPADDLPCGYACSDHASFNRAGYPTAYPFEAVTGNDNPYIHSANDTTSVDGFSWDHSLEFAKIAAAFAYELAI